MFKENYKITKITNQQLINDHKIIHIFWTKVQGDKRILDRRSGDSWNKEDVYNRHKLIVEEMTRRGLDHNIIDPALDKLKLPQELNEILSSLKTVILVKDFISLIGSNSEGRENPEDIDLVIKQTKRSTQMEQKFLHSIPINKLQKFHIVYNKDGSHGKYIPLYDLVLVRRNGSIDFSQTPKYEFPMFGPAPKLESYNHFERIFLHRYLDEVKLLNKDGFEIDGFEEIRNSARSIVKPKEFILEGTLLSDNTFRVIDIWRWSSTELVQVKRPERIFFLNKIERDIPNFSWVYEDEDINFEETINPMKAFQPLKTQQGYGEYEFNNPEDLWKFWADGENIKKGIAVEQKFDGFRLVIHKSGNEVKIFTEDKKRDISDKLPMIAAEVKKSQYHTFILDSETVWWKNNAPLPRHKMMAIIGGKEPLSGEDIRANIFDCLYFLDKDLHNLPWSERQKYLRQIIPKDGTFLKRVIPTIVTDKESLFNAIDILSSKTGSEGVMCKVTDSIYPLKGRSTQWAKLKVVKEVHLKVIGKRMKKAAGGGESKTFLYRVAFKKEEGLEPIWSQNILGPKDMEEESEWKMGLGFPNGKIGEYKYGESYGTNIDADIGKLITVSPIHILEFTGKDGKKRFAWMFPRVKNLETALNKPDTLDDIKRIAAMSETKSQKEKIKLEDIFNLLRNEDFPITVEVI